MKVLYLDTEVEIHFYLFTMFFYLNAIILTTIFLESIVFKPNTIVIEQSGNIINVSLPF